MDFTTLFSLATNFASSNKSVSRVEIVSHSGQRFIRIFSASSIPFFGHEFFEFVNEIYKLADNVAVSCTTTNDEKTLYLSLSVF